MGISLITGFPKSIEYASNFRFHFFFCFISLSYFTDRLNLPLFVEFSIYSACLTAFLQGQTFQCPLANATGDSILVPLSALFCAKA